MNIHEGGFLQRLMGELSSSPEQVGPVMTGLAAVRNFPECGS